MFSVAPRYLNALVLAPMEAHECEASTAVQAHELVMKECAGRRGNAFLTLRHFLPAALFEILLIRIVLLLTKR